MHMIYAQILMAHDLALFSERASNLANCTIAHLYSNYTRTRTVGT